MKKIFSTIILSVIVGMTMAQTVTTYSVYDANHNGTINVADVTTVVENAKANVNAVNTQQYVLADELATTLQAIDSRLSALEGKLGISSGGESGGQGTSSILLPGKFTVNSDGKQVQFTKANLFWNGKKFKLEATQTDCPDVYDSNHVGHFYWTKIENYISGTSTYMPYAESYSYTDGRTVNDHFWCQENSPLYVEWTDDLYVLDCIEWNYVLDCRSHASDLCKYPVTVTDGTKTSTNCLIIAPDNYDYTNNQLKSSYTLDEINSLNIVCLPATGYRINKNLTDGGERVVYWSSTPYDQYVDSGYCIHYNDNLCTSYTNWRRNNGASIRLVSTVQ